MRRLQASPQLTYIFIVVVPRDWLRLQRGWNTCSMPKQQFNWWVSCRLMGCGIVGMCSVRYPFILVALIFRDVMSEVFNNNPMATFQAPICCWVEHGSLSLLNLQQFANMRKKFAPWSVKIILGIAYFNTMFSTNARATVPASCFGMGIAAINFVKSSWNVSMYRFPALDMSVGPAMSSAHLSKGCLAMVVNSIGAFRRGLNFLFSSQILHCLT
jgi:hypothetical protein